MEQIQLEYRISYAHTKMIVQGDSPVHKHNQYWSCARHLPPDWDLRKIEKRRSVVTRLLDNLRETKRGRKMDVSPLLDDQRASGVIYGRNPLQSMFDLVGRIAERYPSEQFHIKWGGGQYGRPGKGFAFYVDDADDAQHMIALSQEVAEELGVAIDAYHRHGIEQYEKFVTVDAHLRSKVNERRAFEALLLRLEDYPHFFHELFLTDEHPITATR
jgi:hypothetical protein